MLPTSTIRCLIAAAAAVLASFALDAHAFCVYNKTSGASASFYEQVPVSHIKTLFKSYQTSLGSGKNGCCNWKNKDCNPDGKQNSDVEFQVHVSMHSSYIECFNGSHDALNGNKQQLPKIEAGGWLELVDNPKFDRSKKKYGYENPPYVVLTYRTNGQSMGSFPCPGYASDTPGLMDFL